MTLIAISYNLLAIPELLFKFFNTLFYFIRFPPVCWNCGEAGDPLPDWINATRRRM